MKFPGRRLTKHYFPITDKDRSVLNLDNHLNKDYNVYCVGIDQLLVDIEINVTDQYLEKHNFTKGQSFLIDDNLADEIYENAKSQNLVYGEFPGGAVGNTLHNFSVLSDTPSYTLGAIKKEMQIGDYAFKYVAKTNSLVNLSYLQPAQKPMGRALCFITPDLERTFAISKGCMNELTPDFVPDNLVKGAAALLISAYTIRAEGEPIFESTLKAVKVAKENKIPVILSLGTSMLVDEHKDYLLGFIEEFVSVVAMNKQESIALTGEDDPLKSIESLLDITDMVLLTVGEKGLYVGGLCDQEHLRSTKEPLVTKTIVNYNEFEYSRCMKRSRCKDIVKIYTHISPFKGGPSVIKNTNGAGDAALAAVLHDVSANCYHKKAIPNSPKHDSDYLTYSSIGQISKYANRVSYEILLQNSPRLLKGLPIREDSLEDSYWSK